MSEQVAIVTGAADRITPEAVADLLSYLAGDAAAPISGAVVPAYGA